MNEVDWAGGGPAAEGADPIIPFGKGWDLARRLLPDAYGRPRPGAAYLKGYAHCRRPPIWAWWLVTGYCLLVVALAG